ncbi:MAG: hypothetical protein ACK5LV_06175 [Lachnospirales bacterium]
MLELKKIGYEDLENVMTWRMLPEVTKYMFSDPVLTVENQKKWLDNILHRTDVLYWIIYFDNTPIGV